MKPGLFLTIAAAGLAGIAVLSPQARWLCLLLFAVLVLVAIWPDRRAVGRIRDTAPGGHPHWPGRDLKAVVSALDEPILVIDRGMILRYRNEASVRAFGHLPVGDPVSLRFRAPELLAAVTRTIETNNAETASFEERRPLERSWFLDVRPVHVAAGHQADFFLLVFHDRTRELRVERIRTDFVANASHELRTPLASLSGFIETLQGPAKDDAAARERFLGIMQEQAARMARLIDDLLSLSRIEMNRHVPVSQSIDLATLLPRVVEGLAPVAAQYEVDLVVGSLDEPAMVLGDETQLVQVFSNLIENACKYGGDGGRVEVAVRPAIEHGESRLDVEVRDFGAGIARDHLPRLTERFYRVNVGTSRARQGTGLGLSIVRNILLRHRARLIVESELGEGSVFTARFPVSGKSPQEGM